MCVFGLYRPGPLWSSRVQEPLLSGFPFLVPASVLGQGPKERNLEPLHLDPRCPLIQGQELTEEQPEPLEVVARTLPIGFKRPER